jgi:hypothetical protein
MKRAFFILWLFLTHVGFAQESFEDKQKWAYLNSLIKRGEEHLQKNEIWEAFFVYGSASLVDSLSDVGKKAYRKADSLKSILQRDLLRDIKGTWKWKWTGSNWGTGETSKQSEEHRYLVITDELISIYHIDKKTKKKSLIRQEKIKFNSIPGMSSPYFSEFVYSDNQIWIYAIQDKRKFLHLTDNGEVLEDNRRTEIICGNTEMTYKRKKFLMRRLNN